MEWSMPSILAAHAPSPPNSPVMHKTFPETAYSSCIFHEARPKLKHINIKISRRIKIKKRTCFIKHQETHLGAHPPHRATAQGCRPPPPSIPLLFPPPFTQSLSFSASAHSICLPCLPLFLPLSLFLSLPARVIVPLSIPVSLSGFPPASLCFFLPLSLFLSHCLPGSPSQHCSKLAPPPFSLLSVCQSLLLSHTHENG